MKREIIYVHIIKRRGKTWFRSKRPMRVGGGGASGEREQNGSYSEMAGTFLSME